MPVASPDRVGALGPNGGFFFTNQEPVYTTNRIDATFMAQVKKNKSGFIIFHAKILRV